MARAMLTEDEYVELAQKELKSLISALDQLEGDELEAELENDIITIEIGDAATYVINSHRAARQIWMAAERTAWHFDYEPERAAWIASKTGDELWSALRTALQTRLGQQAPPLPPRPAV